MILFHASNAAVPNPDLDHSRDFLDFGKGFYLTSLKEQAVRYSERFKLRGQSAVLNVYECDDDLSELSRMAFSSYDETWLEFVGNCRQGNDKSDYDIVEGGIANDKIFRTVDLYFSGDITKEDALKKLMMENPNHQICFRTEKSLSHLKFIESINL